MPTWLKALIIIVVILLFIVPNPTGAGAYIGGAFNAVATFFKSIAGQISLR